MAVVSTDAAFSLLAYPLLTSFLFTLALLPSEVRAQAKTTPPSSTASVDELVVTARTAGAPERSLDQNAISDLGGVSIDEALQQLSAQSGNLTSTWSILINGRPAPSSGGIGNYPPEALERIDILPQGAGPDVTQSPTARVINLVLRPRFSALTAILRGQTSVEGGAENGTASLMHTWIRKETRLNITADLTAEAALLESDRHLLQPTPSPPDKVRSGLVPSGDYMAWQERASAIDAGRFRTLRPRTNTFTVNAEGATRLGDAITTTATANIRAGDSLSLNGLPALLFFPWTDGLYPTFDEEARAALYSDARPLTSRIKDFTATFGVGGQVIWNEWTFDLTGQFDFRRRRQESTTTGALDGQSSASLGLVGARPIDGFGALLEDQDVITRSHSAELRGVASGRILQLPAGPLRATLSALARTSRASATDVAGSALTTTQDEARGQLGVDLPILSGRAGKLQRLGRLNARVSYEAIRASQTGPLARSSYSLIWAPRPSLQLTASQTLDERPVAPTQLRGAPLLTGGVRFYDIARSETVDVTTLSGGNPALRPPRIHTRQVTAAFTVSQKPFVQTSLEYSQVSTRDGISPVPANSLSAVTAYPDRFLRAGDGRLYFVDLRPINIYLQQRDQLRWGANFRLPLSRGSRKILNANLSYTLRLKERTILGRNLSGEIVSGSTLGDEGIKHRIDGSAGLTLGALNLRAWGSWRGPAQLGGTSAALRVRPLAVVNLQAFYDVGRSNASAAWARNLRLTLTIGNVSGVRPQVVDSAGATPLRYQPAFMDPLGRTIAFEVRKQL